MNEEYPLEKRNVEIWYPLTNFHASEQPKRVKVIVDKPPHVPTKHDLDRIAKAQARRERRNSKKNAP